MDKFNLEKAESNIREWILKYQIPAEQYPMFAGEKYTNVLNKTYIVLEDSPAGNAEVKVLENFSLGKAIRYIHKAVLLKDK